MTRVAAIDCGTNSIRLLVADVAGSTLTDVVRRMEVVRLGEGVDRTGQLSAAALERTFAAVELYATQLRELGAERVCFVATSATRDARNRDVFVDGIRERLGVEPEVVPGAVEAALSFDGATREFTGQVRAPFLVVDIGGGSTEFVLGDADGVTAARSVDIGCVRLTERHLHGDPATAEQIDAARADIRDAIDQAAESVDLAECKTLVGVAGSVTTVAAMSLGLATYDSDAIHGSRIPADDVRRVSDTFLAMTRSARAAFGFMHPGRADVIGAGALVLREIVDRVGADEVLVSEHDILDGIAFSLAD